MQKSVSRCTPALHRPGLHTMQKQLKSIRATGGNGLVVCVVKKNTHEVERVRRPGGAREREARERIEGVEKGMSEKQSSKRVRNRGPAFECSSGRVVKVKEAICWRNLEGR